VVSPPPHGAARVTVRMRVELSPASVPPPSVGRRFSTDLKELIVHFGEKRVRLDDLLAETRGRGYHFLLLLIALPFVGPIPLPGFSIPFGLVVTILGMRIAVGKPPWLPRFLREKSFDPKFLTRVLLGTSRLMEWVEIFLRPRLGFVDAHAVFSRFAGFLIGVSGLMLMLPLPLPFSNSLPAWTVIFLAAGALGHDGLFFLLGCGSFVVSVAFFTFVAVGGAAAVEQLARLIPGGWH
jgi:hypothetical protein